MTNGEKYVELVDAQIAGDRKHGWGVEDSMAVIGGLWANETGAELPEDLKELIKSVVNPSAFRLKLESKAVNKLDAPVKGAKASGLVAGLLKKIEPEA